MLCSIFAFSLSKITLCEVAPQLQHLHLRYCKRMTDVGIGAIAGAMPDLYSLDLTFCTRVTAAGVRTLLDIRGNSLSELRLQSCRSLVFVRDPDDPATAAERSADAGRLVLNALKSRGETCCLAVLDVRRCGGHEFGPDFDEGYPAGDQFARGMASLGFEQSYPGYFSRPARWNSKIQQKLAGQFLALETAKAKVG